MPGWRDNMASLSGIVKNISDLVSGTPADDDCFIFGKTDIKKITLAKLKDTLGITSINTALEIEAFDNERELINYAEDLLTSDTYLLVKPFAVGDNSPSSFQFGYSVGFLLKRYDSIAIYVFSYNGSIFSNGKTKNSDWIGWGRFDPIR